MMVTKTLFNIIAACAFLLGIAESYQVYNYEDVCGKTLTITKDQPNGVVLLDNKTLNRSCNLDLVVENTEHMISIAFKGVDIPDCQKARLQVYGFDTTADVSVDSTSSEILFSSSPLFCGKKLETPEPTLIDVGINQRLRFVFQPLKPISDDTIFFEFHYSSYFKDDFPDWPVVTTMASDSPTKTYKHSTSELTTEHAGPSTVEITPTKQMSYESTTEDSDFTTAGNNTERWGKQETTNSEGQTSQYQLSTTTNDEATTTTDSLTTSGFSDSTTMNEEETTTDSLTSEFTDSTSTVMTTTTHVLFLETTTTTPRQETTTTTPRQETTTTTPRQETTTTTPKRTEPTTSKAKKPPTFQKPTYLKTTRRCSCEFLVQRYSSTNEQQRMDLSFVTNRLMSRNINKVSCNMVFKCGQVCRAYANQHLKTGISGLDTPRSPGETVGDHVCRAVDRPVLINQPAKVTLIAVTQGCPGYHVAKTITSKLCCVGITHAYKSVLCGRARVNNDVFG